MASLLGAQLLPLGIPTLGCRRADASTAEKSYQASRRQLPIHGLAPAADAELRFVLILGLVTGNIRSTHYNHTSPAFWASTEKPQPGSLKDGVKENSHQATRDNVRE